MPWSGHNNPFDCFPLSHRENKSEDGSQHGNQRPPPLPIPYKLNLREDRRYLSPSLCETPTAPHRRWVTKTCPNGEFIKPRRYSALLCTHLVIRVKGNIISNSNSAKASWSYPTKMIGFMAGREAQSSRMCTSVPHEVMMNQHIFMIVENPRNQPFEIKFQSEGKVSN